MLREGRIRRGTQRDVDEWVAATRIDPGSVSGLGQKDFGSGGQFLFRTYVVNRAMTFPPGLHGAHSAIFIVPRNVARPYGDPGHSRVLEYPKR